MDAPLLRAGFQRALVTAQNPAKRRVLLQLARRQYATASTDSFKDDIRAAAPIQFTGDANQFSSRDQRQPNRTRSARNSHSGAFSSGLSGSGSTSKASLLSRVRIIPASPSYFTATPQYTDALLYLSSLLRKYQLLPTCAPGQAPKVAWKTLEQYRIELAEPVRAKAHSQLIQVLKRLNQIHPALLPVEVERAMLRYKRNIQPHLNQANPIEMDKWGRMRAVGRRKSSNAAVWLVEGEGECLVNGKTLSQYFARIHDRESAVWALKATQRLDKYNVFAIARGGGTTGQAEAITLGVAKALLAHEPDLKPALRRAGCLTRDRRKVERKKPGKLKARKMPAWVKR